VTLSIEGGTEVRSGAHLSSVLAIINATTTDLVVGKLIPPVVDPSNGRVVGGYEGAITLELRRDTVPAGTSKEVPILIGTASLDPALGYAVPPGEWALRILLELGDEHFQGLITIMVVP
jgi:hypothetical protein